MPTEQYRMLVDDLVSCTLQERPGIFRMFDYYEGLSPSLLTPRMLFTEVCWIGYASGFRYDIVDRYWPRISKALYGFDVLRVAAEELTPSKAASRICEVSGFRNMSKASWAVANAKRILELDEELSGLGGIRRYFETLAEESPYELVHCAPSIIRQLGFKGIGKTTIFHLMKNIGMDVFKPDIHVRRLLANMRLISNENAPVEEVCSGMVFLSTASGYKVSQVDTFLFAYGITIGDNLTLERAGAQQIQAAVPT